MHRSSHIFISGGKKVGDSIITLKNVSAGYGDFDVVKDISFSVKENESLSIIGPNGCGKTTLLRAITNQISYNGEILIDGEEAKKLKPGIIAKKISMLSQTSEIYFSYSVFETVMMGRYIHLKDRFFGKPTEADVKIVTDCLLTCDLLDVKDKDIAKLSGGQLQRVFLARTLAQEPDIILLDEPTNHLDLKYQIELTEYLKKWSKMGSHAVIGVLHDINLAIRLSDNIMVMKEGRINAFGTLGKEITGALINNVYDTDITGYMSLSLEQWKNLNM